MRVWRDQSLVKDKLFNFASELSSKHSCHIDLSRLPPRESTLDGRWTRKPFGLSRVQPIYLSIPCPS